MCRGHQAVRLSSNPGAETEAVVAGPADDGVICLRRGLSAGAGESSLPSRGTWRAASAPQDICREGPGLQGVGPRGPRGHRADRGQAEPSGARQPAAVTRAHREVARPGHCLARASCRPRTLRLAWCIWRQEWGPPTSCCEPVLRLCPRTPGPSCGQRPCRPSPSGDPGRGLPRALSTGPPGRHHAGGPKVRRCSGPVGIPRVGIRFTSAPQPTKKQLRRQSGWPKVGGGVASSPSRLPSPGPSRGRARASGCGLVVGVEQTPVRTAVQPRSMQ